MGLAVLDLFQCVQKLCTDFCFLFLKSTFGATLVMVMALFCCGRESA